MDFPKWFDEAFDSRTEVAVKVQVLQLIYK